MARVRPGSKEWNETGIAQMSDQKRYDEIAQQLPPFGQIFGLRVLQAHPDCLRAELLVTEALSNRNGVLHGGAIMGLADNLGGTATFLNLAEGQGTTTIESKTNFLRSVAIGETLTTETTPLHRGRRTHVWQTRLIRSDGKLAAVVTQTQMILNASG
ncbi:phenylacetic acid degradation protein [Roseinatronobacter bogoriensis subsp. barguzinensis]|uniref:Phenylacetic acid degradation protein n=2 Tax=Roseinatronobacter bogoriensis TaxID=119542 RepID=A0A2K8KDA0_9RHOB|nr:phenylacetic acid degradation protein [Rhodobaca barguzinensis]